MERLIAKGEREVDDIVIFGAGRMGATIAGVLSDARHPRAAGRRESRARA